MNTALNKVIIALDYMDNNQIESFIKKTRHKIQFYKIGMQTYYRYGPDFLKKLQSKFEIDLFLDLKLHDIPNTVFGAIKSLQDLPVKFLTLHLSGGQSMCQAAVKARDEFLPQTKLIGVSLLTSLNEQDFKNLYSYNNHEQVKQMMNRLKVIAKNSSIDGMVCSAHELDELRDTMTVCPGIRFQDEIDGQQVQDQSRVMSPEKAIKSGANFLVIGRSLTQSDQLEQRLEQLESI